VVARSASGEIGKLSLGRLLTHGCKSGAGERIRSRFALAPGWL